MWVKEVPMKQFCPSSLHWMMYILTWQIHSPACAHLSPELSPKEWGTMGRRDGMWVPNAAGALFCLCRAELCSLIWVHITAGSAGRRRGVDILTGVGIIVRMAHVLWGQATVSTAQQLRSRWHSCELQRELGSHTSGDNTARQIAS